MRSTPPREDPGLPVFGLTEGAAHVPRLEPELALSAPASSRPVWLHGARASVLAGVRGGCREIHVDGRRVLAPLEVMAGAVANAVVSPGLLRRERVSAGGSVQETVLVAPTLPLVVLSLEGPEGADRVELTALPEGVELRYHIDRASVTVGEAGSGSLLGIAALPASARWSVDPGARGGVRLRCDGPEGVRALAISYGSERAVRTALSATRHLAGHAVGAGAAPADDLLTLRSGVSALDDAVAWMQRRLSAGIGLATRLLEDHADPPADDDRRAWLWAGLGACAVGDAEGAASCITALERLGRREEALLLAARVSLRTGRSEGLLERATGLEAAGRGGLGGRPYSAVGRLALRSAADALRYAAPEAVIERLRAHGRASGRSSATTVEDAGRVGFTGRRLPTVGGTVGGGAAGSEAVHPSQEAIADRLLFLLEDTGTGVRPASRAEPPGGGWRLRTGSALDAWTALAASDPDGWARWRGLVAEGLDGEDRGVASWDDFVPERPPAVTAILLAGLAHGWLGARPDAPVGRLRLAPGIPPHVTAFRFEHIGVGDARVSLSYARDGRTHAFEITPEGGRVPPLAIFEATVPTRAVRVVRIDGETTDVEAEPGRAGTIVRLQTPVDGARRIEIEEG